MFPNGVFENFGTSNLNLSPVCKFNLSFNLVPIIAVLLSNGNSFLILILSISCFKFSKSLLDIPFIIVPVDIFFEDIRPCPSIIFIKDFILLSDFNN